MRHLIVDSLVEGRNLLDSFLQDSIAITQIEMALSSMVSSLRQEGTIFSCGNGGSFCDAAHFAEEMTGRFHQDRPPLRAIAISDPSHMSCVSNDYGYEKVFSRFIEGVARKNDSLLAISTSGNSKNIIEAVSTANKMGLTTIGLLGKDGGKLKDLVHIPIIVPHQATERIQEIHIKIIHILIAGIEKSLFPNL